MKFGFAFHIFGLGLELSQDDFSQVLQPRAQRLQRVPQLLRSPTTYSARLRGLL